MKIKITPIKSNIYPKKGILIKGDTPKDWLLVLQKLNINLEEIPVFPVPSSVANKLYGCFFVLNTFNDKVKELNVSIYQSYHDFIYIPILSKISPKITKEEAQKIFKEPHVFHPDFGWVELNEPIAWKTILQIEDAKPVEIIKPAKTVFIPGSIKSFQLIANEEIDILKSLDLKLEKPINDKLNGYDKARLKLFKTFFSSKKNNKGGFDIAGKGLLKWLNSNNESKGISNSKFKGKFEKLLYRNQKETDKLLSLFKSNPNLALSRAIPLDMLGTSRGTNEGALNFFSNKKEGNEGKASGILSWIIVFIIIIFFIQLLGSIISGASSDLFWGIIKTIGFILLIPFLLKRLKGSLSKPTGGGSSGTIDSDRMDALRKEYERMAEEAAENKDYKKAASIYIKLLKNNYKAAQTLEEGKFYEEAAVIYLKFNNNKEMAAKAYENGKFYKKAIKLYKEIDQNEKVGDLYKSINNKVEADKHFQLVADDYLNKSQFVKASLVYKYKIEDTTKAQAPLLKGWQEKIDAQNCLDNYFGNISDKKLLKERIKNVYEKETDNSNIKTFLKVLKVSHDKHESIHDITEDIAYKAVAKYIKENPDIAFSLSSFKGDNSFLETDINKFVKKTKKRN